MDEERRERSIQSGEGRTARPNGGAHLGSEQRIRPAAIEQFRSGEFLRGLVFWVPPFVLMAWFVYGAVGWNFLISLTDWSGLAQPDYSDLNFAVYHQFFERMMVGATLEARFGGTSEAAAVRNTIVLLVVFTLASLAVGLALAILIDQGIRFENTFRTIYLLPMALSFVVTAILWSWMYNPTVGVINQVLASVGLGALQPDWLGDPRLKLSAIMIALTWQFSGYCMVVYLAGLRAIPSEHYEAAKVDGASTIRMYRRVILPQLRAATTAAAVVLMVFALKAFDFIFVLFGDTPGPSADILSVMMFREAFSRNQWAYGSGVAMVLFVMALAVIAPYLYAQYRRGEL